MNKTCYTIYWTLADQAWSEDTYDLNYALKRIEQLRKCPGYRAITMCAENLNQVGKMGVEQIKDGILPNGLEYEWKKTMRNRE